MDGRIPIYQGTERVGSIAWRGTMGSGSWVFLANPKITDEVRRMRLRKQIQFAHDANQHLVRSLFQAESGVMYRGWSGFTGVINALDQSLPAVGLRVEWNGTHWPGKRLPKTGPVDLDIETRRERALEVQQENEAIEQWDLLAFRERNPG